MKIHLTGAHWHGAITLNLERAFRALGHEVIFFDKYSKKADRIVKNLASRIGRRNFELDYFFSRKRSREWLDSVFRTAPDVIVIEDAPNILAESVRKARDLKKPIIYYLTAPPHGSGAKDEMLSLRYVDYVFCIDSDWANIASYFFEKPIHHLPLAGNPDDFYLMPDAEEKYDVTFIGSVPEQSPDGLLRAHIVDEIPKKYNVALFGNGWQYWLRYFPRLKSRIKAYSSIPVYKANEVINQSKIVLNFHSTGHTASISGRTYEVALAGGFQIADPRVDLETLFPPQFFPTFTSIPEMNALIERWLPMHGERKAAGEKAREFVLEHHTWLHRVKTLLGAITP